MSKQEQEIITAFRSLLRTFNLYDSLYDVAITVRPPANGQVIATNDGRNKIIGEYVLVPELLWTDIRMYPASEEVA